MICDNNKEGEGECQTVCVLCGTAVSTVHDPCNDMEVTLECTS